MKEGKRNASGRHFLSGCCLVLIGIGTGCGGSIPEVSVSPTPSASEPPLPSPTPSWAPSQTPEPPSTLSESPSPTQPPTVTPTATPTPAPEAEQTDAPPTITSPPSSFTPSPSPSPTPSKEWGCPEEMATVLSPAQEPLFCIDPYEVTVTGNLGTSNQHTWDTVVTTATTRSMKNVIPSVNVSYDQAVQACENTPVLAPDGLTILGYKHMATSQEWIDAADGIAGEGGALYPYGDVYDPTLCATLDANDTQVYFELQPTGSLPQCVSVFGVYDQSGNAWEWADSGIFVSIEGWMLLATQVSVNIASDPQGWLYALQSRDASLVQVDMVGVQNVSPTRDERGYLFVAESSVLTTSTESLRGYLKLTSGEVMNAPANFLPIQLVLDTNSHRFYVYLLYSEEGMPVPDKRGGAYYVGNSYAYSNPASQRIHTHDFDGTIGFRCASDLIQRGQ